MNRCWAASLGNCSDKISREHIITEGLFLDEKIRVKGLPWCRDKFREIGHAGNVKKVLCTVHNSLLSEVDDTAIALAKALRETVELVNRFKVSGVQPGVTKVVKIDGFKLERWFLKTLITNAAGGTFLVGKDAVVPGSPPLGLVEVAFGLRRFQAPAGLYVIGEPGEKWSEDGVRITTFGDRAGMHAGARFWFRGVDFMLLLHGKGLGNFIFTSLDGKETTQIPARYHPSAVNLGAGNQLLQSIQLIWNHIETT
jgi:hypothetical protein